MKRNPIESPCIGVCQFTLPKTKCRGCGRTQDEAFNWYDLSDDERDQVWARIIKENDNTNR